MQFDPSICNITSLSLELIKECSKKNFTSYETEEDLVPLYYKGLALIFLISIGFIGIVGNLMVIFVVISFKSMHTSTNFYLSSLAFADFLVLCSTLPFEVMYFFVQHQWLFGDLACRFTTYIQFTAINCSALNIFAFSFERYKAICYPLQSYTSKESTKMICCVWTFCLIYHLSWFFSTSTKHHEKTNLTICTYSYSREIYIYFYITDFILFYVVTLLISGYMYIRIYQKLYKSSKFSNLVTVRLNNCSDDNNFHLSKSYSTVSKNKSDECSKSKTRNEPDSDSILNQNSDLNSFNRQKSLSQSSFCALNHKNSFNYHRDLAFSSSDRSSIKNSLGNKSQFNSSIKYYKNSKTQLELGDEISQMHNDEYKRREVKATKTRGNKKDSVALSSKSNKNKGMRLRELTKIVRMLILVVVIFATFLFPYRFILVYNSIVEDKVMNFWLLFVFKLLVAVNSMINPILYNLMSKKFREHFEKLLKFIFCIKQKSLKRNSRTSLTIKT